MRIGEKGECELKRNRGERETAFIFSLRNNNLLSNYLKRKVVVLREYPVPRKYSSDTIFNSNLSVGNRLLTSSWDFYAEFS